MLWWALQAAVCDPKMPPFDATQSAPASGWGSTAQLLLGCTRIAGPGYGRTIRRITRSRQVRPQNLAKLDNSACQIPHV